MFFNLKTKVISKNSLIVVYGGKSFFLKVWLYRLLMEKKFKLVLITSDPAKIDNQSEWRFFSSHPRLTIYGQDKLGSLARNHNFDFFIDTSLLSLYENLDNDLSLHVDAGFGILNRLAAAYQASAKYVLLSPLTRNLSSETGIYYQIKHHQSFLNSYQKTYELAYQIIQTADYLSPYFITKPSQSFMSLVLSSCLAGRSAFNLNSQVFLADIDEQIKVIEAATFGLSQPIISLRPEPIDLKQFFNLLGCPGLISLDKAKLANQVKPATPTFLTNNYQEIKKSKYIDIKKIKAYLGQSSNHRPAKQKKAKLVEPAGVYSFKTKPSAVKIKTKPKKNNWPRFQFKFKVDKPSLNDQKQSPAKPTPYLKYALIGFLTLLTTISLPLTILTYHIFNGLNYLNKAGSVDSLSRIEASEISSQSKLAINSFKRARSVNVFASGLFRLLGMAKANDNLNDIIDYFIAITQTNQNLANLPVRANQMFSYIFNQEDKDRDFNYYYHKLNQTNQTSLTELNKATALYDAKVYKYENISTFGLGDKIKSSHMRINDLRSSLSKFQLFLDRLPSLTGQDSKKEYLVVLMDNNQLRPAGGLLTAYLVMVFQDGQLLDSQIRDIYALDNQIKGRINPPEPIEKYLGQINWQFRDAGWAVNYPDTARQLAWFYTKSTGQDIDGIIALDLDFLADAGKAWGGYYLPEVNLKLTGANLIRQAYLWGDLTKGNQNLIFTSLLKSFLLKVKNLNQNNLVKFGSILNQSIQTKNFRAYFTNGDLQLFAKKMVLDGRVIIPECKDECLTVGGLIAEANMGINRVNAILDQKLNLSLAFKKDRVYQTISLFIKNPSRAPKWPAGDYKDYLQVFVDKNWQLEKVQVVDETIDLDKVNVSSYSGLVAYGFYHQVDYGQNQTVSLEFSQPLANDKTSLDTLFWLVEQPGIRQLQTILEIKPDKNQQIKIISPKDWQKTGDKAIYQQKLTKDLVLPVRIKTKFNQR